MMTTEEANQLLPEEAISSAANPKALVYTIIAEPKWGKSTWMTSIPNSLLLAFEQGHAFIKAHKLIIDAWDYIRKDKPEPYKDEHGYIHMTMVQALEVILVSDRYDFVIIDTTDMAVKMCLDYQLKRLGLAHQTDWDYGKGHDMAMNTPFRHTFGQIIKSGRGVGFITHTDIQTSQFASATKSKRDCTLPSGIKKFVVPQSDVILNGKFGPRLANGKRSRLLVTEGADDVLAGMRGNIEVNLPPTFIVNHADPWGQWEEFFTSPEACEKAMAEYAILRGSKEETETTPTPSVPERKKAKAR